MECRPPRRGFIRRVALGGERTEEDGVSQRSRRGVRAQAVRSRTRLRCDARVLHPQHRGTHAARTGRRDRGVHAPDPHGGNRAVAADHPECPQHGVGARRGRALRDRAHTGAGHRRRGGLRDPLLRDAGGVRVRHAARAHPRRVEGTAPALRGDQGDAWAAEGRGAHPGLRHPDLTALSPRGQAGRAAGDRQQQGARRRRRGERVPGTGGALRSLRGPEDRHQRRHGVRRSAAGGRVRGVRRPGGRDAGGVPHRRVIVGGMQDVFAYIDQHRDRFIERLQWLCRQPSIAAQNVGVQETAQMVAQLMREVGVTSELYATDGAPVVYGTAGDRGRTLLIYNHYDVQPPEPLELWESPPFAAEVRDGRVYARGAADNKGNLVARLCAVEAWLRVRGALPLTVRFVVEGEEEVSSAHLHQFVREHRDLIQADGCLWAAGGKDIQENPGLYIGAKGILYVELEARGANRDVHSSQATIVPNPAWRMVWALATLKDRNEQVLIEGFYDDVVEPTREEMEHLRRIAAQRDDELRRRDLGLDAFLLGLSGIQLIKRNLFQPTCTICGIGSGYTRQGSNTMLPSPP